MSGVDDVEYDETNDWGEITTHTDQADHESVTHQLIRPKGLLDWQCTCGAKAPLGRVAAIWFADEHLKGLSGTTHRVGHQHSLDCLGCAELVDKALKADQLSRAQQARRDIVLALPVGMGLFHSGPLTSPTGQPHTERDCWCGPKLEPLAK